MIVLGIVIRKVLIRNKFVLRNHLLLQIAYLLHKNKEHLALRNNFRVTKKFLITKFDRILTTSSVEHLGEIDKEIRVHCPFPSKSCQFSDEIMLTLITKHSFVLFFPMCSARIFLKYIMM